MPAPHIDLSDYTPSADLATAETMPARWYTDAQILAVEQEKIFARTWQPVGKIEDVMRAGDFFTCEVAGRPLVITRGTDNRLRGFYNVCPHRAGVVADGRGNRKSLQCKYHGWTYNLEGKLLRAPEFDGVKNWNPAEVCLTPVRVHEWGAWVFVNLDAAAPPMDSIYAPIQQEISQAGFYLDRMRFVERREYVIKCNWKVYVDNYLEGYHLPIAHPDLFREIDYDQYRVETHRYFPGSTRLSVR